MKAIAACLIWAIDSCATRQEMRECAEENKEALEVLDEHAPELRAMVKEHSAKRWQEVK